MKGTCYIAQVMSMACHKKYHFGLELLKKCSESFGIMHQSPTTSMEHPSQVPAVTATKLERWKGLNDSHKG